MMISKEYIESVVQDELNCDIGTGDITSLSVLPENCRAEGVIIANQSGVICGIEFVKTAFLTLDEFAEFRVLVGDGERVKSKDAVFQISGDAIAILSAERTALNFLCHLSGIATITGQIVDKVSDYNTVILDTRKTTPGLRLAEKYAVECGGGQNHRFGLYDMILIKDNHISAGGGISIVLEKLYRKGKPPIPVEIEITRLEQLKLALEYPLDRIMLDNFTVEQVNQAIRIRKEMNKSTPFECSGGISAENVSQYAKTGVEYISMGMLTHSAPQLDLSLEVELNLP
ncbi:carboxylating nicotinate-nucleotide diphosphorylase [bacterium]|nr:MAG: carboxylating nicotinate-nucleotide diphosphorylase [bacterium]